VWYVSKILLNLEREEGERKKMFYRVVGTRISNYMWWICFWKVSMPHFFCLGNSLA